MMIELRQWSSWVSPSRRSSWDNPSRGRNESVWVEVEPSRSRQSQASSCQSRV